MTQHKFDLHKHFLFRDAKTYFCLLKEKREIFSENIVRSIDKKRNLYDVSSIP